MFIGSGEVGYGVAGKYVMSFDCGTTSTRTILFDHSGKIVSVAYQDFEQIYPNPGWVEHNPLEIWEAQLKTAGEALRQANASAKDIVGIGITNQRETTIVWDKATGKPVMNAIVWQDRRTADVCQELIKQGLSEYIKDNMGLLIDSYFSGTKIKWILDHIDGAKEKADRGELLFGTVDSWLIWNLTGGEVHVTDYSNASRTMLFNIHQIEWDDKLLTELDIPRAMLPDLRPSSEVYGMTVESLFGASIPVAAAVGDQQGALFGQACFDAGMVKATFGTGGSLLMNTGAKPIKSDTGLLTTVAWGLNNKVEYALEGLLYVVGASVQWLRDELKLISDAKETEHLAQEVENTNGVYVVPAFVGLSAPYWDQYARGAILGLTRGANRNHIVRATLESIAYQIRDVIACMEQDSGISNRELKVDGGVCNNNFVMQFQSDLLGVPVIRPKIVESTARGAAFLAGLATGFWKSQSDLVDTFELDRKYEPTFDESKRNQLYAGWQRAVERAKAWEEI
ncbi:glycerol kinase GlpK [Neobacillus sp. MER 74]|uniref:glycerol kinase GlpK n=1 Tax=Neobacillus sp. MER 74 TaxID=2939566 RepID=UPI002040D94C|nr:glycerol kinase GlpK [Neobacillus sp. MER 74]MCM3118082.1 glycerol kinase GlpK [Neobacillus sp. MER 74]